MSFSWGHKRMTSPLRYGRRVDRDQCYRDRIPACRCWGTVPLCLQHQTSSTTTGEQGYCIISFPTTWFHYFLSLFLSSLLDWWCKLFCLSLFFMEWAIGGGGGGGWWCSLQSWPVEEGSGHLEDLHVVLACKFLFSHPWSLPECPLVGDVFRPAEAHPKKKAEIMNIQRDVLSSGTP